ncbi:hypothetical protein K4H28_02375 [Deefgea tanakiae]|uniref:Lipocalin-like domain-containing protein n=1 Tax=Deefgea tanakiae TaxID=2865840 RepID=A0ABX8Z6T8_9NEIS|nr:hypothetical protein [Deefgea tanakiae]QZA78283.1 hypothetical protein K4H28_02375 [Deefgea tanakiae]
MRHFLILAALLYAGIATAKPVQIHGTWSQQQEIESMEITIAGQWRFNHADQTLITSAAPAQFMTVKSGDWLNQELRHHPAGMMRKLSWSKDAQRPPQLILGQNMSFVGEVIPGWHWDQYLTLANQQQKVKLSPGKPRTVGGWCILISDVRPAKASKPNIANETETRLDWWIQAKPCQ